MGKGPAKFPKQEEKRGKFCHHKTQKLGKSSNFGVVSEIQRAKFGVFITYIFGSKIWSSNKNFRGKFWGQAPRPPIMEVAPWDFVQDSSSGEVEYALGLANDPQGSNSKNTQFQC